MSSFTNSFPSNIKDNKEQNKRKDPKIKIKSEYDYLDDLDEFLDSSEGKDFMSYMDEKTTQDQKDSKIDNYFEDTKKLSNPMEKIYSNKFVKNLDKDEIQQEENSKKHILNNENSLYGKDLLLGEKGVEFENLDEAIKFLDLNNLNIQEQDKNKILELKERFSLEEAKFLAFLNIEFNILNKKMISCSQKCYKDTTKKVRESVVCLNNCRVGIKKAFSYTDNAQKEIVSKHNTCIQELKNFKYISDKTSNFIDCYDELKNDIIDAKKDLKREFNFYV
jgi:hypothetical protein